VRDFLNQKLRGTLSKGKLQDAYEYQTPFFGFYVPFLLYLIQNSLKVKRLRDFTAIYTYIFVLGYATILSKLNQGISQKDTWNLRIQR